METKRTLARTRVVWRMVVLSVAILVSAIYYGEHFLVQKKCIISPGEDNYESDYSSLLTLVEEDEYHIRWQESVEALQSPNRAQNLRFTYYSDGFETEVRKLGEGEENWTSSIKLEGIYKGNKKVYSTSKDVEKTLNKNYLVYDHEDFVIEYINNKEGMRQNFIIKEDPKQEGELEIRLKVESTEHIKIEEEALLVGTRINTREFDEKFRYSDLKVWDAAGKNLVAYMKNSNGLLALCVMDENATYPITIDPLASSTTWYQSGENSGDRFGTSVAGAGDINGDGRSEIIVGAPYYDGGQTDEGKVYVYEGNSGLTASLLWSEEGDVAGALFGWSVSTAGDVDGDGDYEVIIGAPKYTNGETDEGAAFLYESNGSTLSASPDWSYEYDTANSEFGFCVTNAGDINDDGYSDVLIGAPYADADDYGSVCVFLGSSSGLETTMKQEVDGIGANGHFGYSVDGIGDYNNDGYGDMIVGVPGYMVNRGRIEIFRGQSDGTFETLTNVKRLGNGNSNDRVGTSVGGIGDINHDGYNDVIYGAPGAATGDKGRAVVMESTGSTFITHETYTGENSNDSLGWAVGGAGDVNGDGYPDVFMSSKSYNSSAGKIYVLHGSSSGLQSGSLGSVEDWYAITGGSGDESGYSVACAGDMNGDGLSDLVYSMPGDHSDEGTVYVYKGEPEELTSDGSDWEVDGPSNSKLGFSVRMAGDIDGDGFDDFVAGGPAYDNGNTDEGLVRVYYGDEDGLGIVSSDDIEGGADNIQLGYSVSWAGDVNGDGYDDIIAGAPFGGTNNEGQARVYHGSSSGINTTADWTQEENQDNAEFGFSVSGAGDVNGDGYDDVIVGAHYYDDGENNEGKVFVYYGSSSGLSTTADWTNQDDQIDSEYGYAVSGAGDVNGDGYDDVIVGAPYYDNGATSNAGKMYIYHGSSSGLAASPAYTFQTSQLSCRFGQSVSNAGDVNGDGYGDVLVGSPLHDNGNTDEGVVFAFYGSSSGITGFDWSMDPDANDYKFGWSVNSAGDINGDGYGDVIMGGPEAPASEKGYIAVAYGSSTGLIVGATPEWSEQESGAQANLGASCSGIGDVNGDGYSDILGGAFGHTTNDGRLHAYYGNGGLSVTRRIRLFDEDLTTIISTQNNFEDERFTIKMEGVSPFGDDVDRKLTWEIKAWDTPFSSGSPITYSTSYTAEQDDSKYGTGELSDTITKIDLGNRLRVRFRYHPAQSLYGQVFSPWYYPNPGGGVAPTSTVPTPVELVSFHAHGEINERKRVAHLQWQVAMEINNSHYTIERSKDAANWEEIGTIQGAGNSRNTLTYNYEDREAYAGTSYYRLKQTDYDGKWEHLGVRSVSFAENSEVEVNIYPNPSRRGNIVLGIDGEIGEEGATISIYSLNGQHYGEVKSEEKGLIQSRGTKLLQTLEEGIYFIQLTNKHQTSIQRFVVVN